MKQIGKLVALTVFSISVDGHGLLTYPSSKNGGTLSVPLGSSSNHFALASYGIIDKAFFDNDHSQTPWKRPGEFDHQLARDLIPGHPETLHPCGCNAGDVEHCAGVVHASGFGQTISGGTVNPPIWKAGSVQETAWNAWANHAGGHIYMLCPKTQFDACRETKLPPNPAQANQAMKDAYLQCVWDCFESNTLDWATEEDIRDDSGNESSNGWSQKIQFQDDPCTFATMKPSTKAGKDGHLWRYTPIPDTLQVTNGGEGSCVWDTVTSFSNTKARDEFEASFGNENVCDWGRDSHTPYNWHVFDKIIIPEDLQEGEYLLSWRWDAYKADQMWSNCADVTIAASSIAGIETDIPPSMCPTSPAPGTSQPSAMPIIAPPTVTSPSPSSPSPPTPTPPPINCPPGYTGMRPHNGCKEFYHCVNGEVAGSLTTCPEGTLFDVHAQYCNWENDVNCESPPPPKGCYSNNFKDCNHPHFQSENSSCHTLWLPEGSRSNDLCIPLWGSCTGQNDSCCEPAICYQDDVVGSYSQCVARAPPTDDSPFPSIPPSKEPSTPPTLPSCIECTNVRNKSMKESGKTCEESKKYIKKRCNKNTSWSKEKKKYCQLSCFNLGLGYEGDLCCNGNQ